MAVEVGEGFWGVADDRVEVEGLGIGEVGVGDGRGSGRPVGGEEAAVGGGVGAGTEIVVVGFGVAFLAHEFVILGAGVGEIVFAAEGVEVGVEAERGGVRAGSDFGHTAGAADLVGEVVEDVGLVVAAGGALTVEVNVFAEGGVGGAAGGIGFVENFAAGSVPVDLAVGFLDAVAVTVVGVVHAAAGLHFGFGVPGVGGGDIGSLVAGGVESKRCGGNLVVGVDADG